MGETVMLPCGHLTTVNHKTGTKTIECPDKECTRIANVKAMPVVTYVISEYEPSMF